MLMWVTRSRRTRRTRGTRGIDVIDTVYKWWDLWMMDGSMDDRGQLGNDVCDRQTVGGRKKAAGQTSVLGSFAMIRVSVSGEW